MIKIPKKISVYGKDWIIQYKWNLRDDDDNKSDGLCDKKNRTIIIDRALNKEYKIRAFLHELNHAIMYELKVDFTSVSWDVLEVISEGLADYYFENFNMRLK